MSLFGYTRPSGEQVPYIRTAYERTWQGALRVDEVTGYFWR